MLDIQTILAPVDFSERSSAALEHAGVLAELLDADLTVAYFLPPPPPNYAAFAEGALFPEPSEAARMLPDLERSLEEFVSKTLGAFPVECIAQQADPAQGIEELVNERDVGLVVIASDGYGAFRRMLLGSVASKLLHDLPVPILTGAHVPEIEPWDRRPYQRIVCAVALDEHSRRALEWAWDFAQTCGAQLDVVHAAPSLELGGTLGGDDWFPPDLRSQIVAHYSDQVAQLVRETGCRAAIHVDASDPADFILRQSELLEADLLVVGRSPHKGFAGRRQRLTYELICRAEIPVLSV
jgi:nucleotide-binding universal stress UspA family protein